MKKILAFNGSPRPQGNTSHLLRSFTEGASANTNRIEVFHPHEMNIEHCHGCLRCNVLKRCSLSGDEWESLSRKIMDADILVFAFPIYFLHMPGPMKTVIDRFRSFNHIQITRNGLIHTPWNEWKKDFVLLLSMGSPDDSHADPVIRLFEYIIRALGSENRLHIKKATRLAVVKQVLKEEDELNRLYEKMNLPRELAYSDAQKNRNVLRECRDLGTDLSGA
jgi:putative NADPH-quinone reductase